MVYDRLVVWPLSVICTKKTVASAIGVSSQPHGASVMYHLLCRTKFIHYRIARSIVSIYHYKIYTLGWPIKYDVLYNTTTLTTGPNGKFGYKRVYAKVAAATK
jgi:hypothetical protein